MSRMSYTNIPTSDTNHDLQLETNLMGYPRQEDSAMIPKASTTNITTIQVIAPATLPEGYEFDVTLPNQRIIKVAVPPGGVETGQTFPINVRNELLLSASPTNASMNGGGSSPTISIPVGHWRDDVKDLFRYGIFHPHCLVSCFCPLRKYDFLAYISPFHLQTIFIKPRILSLVRLTFFELHFHSLPLPYVSSNLLPLSHTLD